MSTISNEKLRKIMDELFQQLGEKTWKNKSSILFSLRSKYGETLNIESASNIYDNILATIEGEDENV